MSRIERINVWAGWYVDYTEFLQNETIIQSGGQVGGTAQESFVLSSDEYIERVDYYQSNNQLRSLQFTTNTQRKSLIYGGKNCINGELCTIVAPEGMVISGLKRISTFCGIIEEVLFEPMITNNHFKPDCPPPPPLEADSTGGDTVGADSLVPNNNSSSTYGSIQRIEVYAGAYVDYTIFHNIHGLQQVGGKIGGQKQKSFVLDNDKEYIQKIEYYQSNKQLHRLQFFTNNGRASEIFGGYNCKNGYQAIIEADNGQEIIGLRRNNNFCGIIYEVLIQDLQLNRSHLTNIGSIRSIQIYSGAYVDYTSFYLKNETEVISGGKIGGQLQPELFFEVDEYIKMIKYREVNNQLRSLQIVTNKGYASPIYGGQNCCGSSLITHEAEDGYEIIGLQRTNSFCSEIDEVLCRKL